MQPFFFKLQKLLKISHSDIKKSLKKLRLHQSFVQSISLIIIK